MSVARDTSTRVAAQGEESRAGRWVVLAALYATQITSWGVLYYAFPVLAGDITMALAPFTGAALASLLGSYATTFLVLGALATVATALSLLTIPK